MTPTKTLYLTKIGDDKYIVNEDGSFLTVQDDGQTFILQQIDNTDTFHLGYVTNLGLDNIETTEASEELVTFEFGGYKFEYIPDDGEYTVSEIPPEFAGTGELVSHNFGVDEMYLCNKDNEVVWGTIGGQKVYFEQSAIGQFSTASNKPQTAAEMATSTIETGQGADFMFAGYVFINDTTNTYICIPTPPDR